SEILNLEPSLLVARLPEAYTAVLTITHCLELHERGIVENRDKGRFALDPEIVLPLGLLVKMSAPWLLEFPSMADMNDLYSCFISKSIREHYITRRFVEIVDNEKVITTRGAQELGSLLDAAGGHGSTSRRAFGRAADRAGALARAIAEIVEEPDLAPIELTMR